jgi:hypothetical protein
METAYRKAGLDVELVTVKYAGHGFEQAGDRPISPSFPEILEKSLAFFQDKLGSLPSPSAAKQ